MNELSLMEKFVDPKLIDTLTVGEKSMGALITTLMGMGITFIVLIMLWGLIAFMARITQEKPGSSSSDTSVPTVKSANMANTPAQTGVSAGTDSSPELIAVIAAAIAAFEGNAVNAGDLIIRKISRVSGQATAWGTAGSSEAIDSRKF